MWAGDKPPPTKCFKDLPQASKAGAGLRYSFFINYNIASKSRVKIINKNIFFFYYNKKPIEKSISTGFDFDAINDFVYAEKYIVNQVYA